jgi:hypothetical protein
MFDTKDLAVAKGIPIKHFSLAMSLNSLWHKRKDEIVYIENVISPDIDIKHIIEHFEKDSKLYDVGVQGLLSNGDEIGSKRVTVYDEGFANYLTTRIIGQLRPLVLNEYSRVDWQSQNPLGYNYAVPVCVSNVFRYMKYTKGGKHNTHYDAPFIHPENPLIRSLMSGVLYLTTNDCSTRFINDSQDNLPFVKRNHQDWVLYTPDSLILKS